MPDTPLGITYPASTDHTRIWEHLQNLAVDADTIIGRKGYVGESARTANVGSITTTETVIQSVTFTAVAGIRYKVSAVQTYQSSVANDLVQVRLRFSAGASLSIGGTEITSGLVNCDIAGRGNQAIVIGTFVPGAGQVTVGVTAVRSGGTGTVTMSAQAAQVATVFVEGI